MNRRQWEQFIETAKQKYYGIGIVSCPALSGADILFNRKGLHHLLVKKRSYRSRVQQKRRLNLVINFGRMIIETSRQHTEYRIIDPKYKSKNGRVHFWSFESEIGEKIITLVVRQVGNGHKHFFSIMDQRPPKSAQTPRRSLS